MGKEKIVAKDHSTPREETKISEGGGDRRKGLREFKTKAHPREMRTGYRHHSEMYITVPIGGGRSNGAGGGGRGGWWGGGGGEGHLAV